MGKFAVLRNRDYALYFGGMLVSQTGMWMQVVAEGWLVLQLTGRVSALGAVHVAFALPNILLSLTGGAVADRFDRRRLVLATQVALMANAVALGALIASGWLTFYVLLGAAAVAGTANAFDIPARQALIPEIVSREQIPHAVALNQAVFNGTRLLGPAIAALVLDRERISAGYFANGASYVAVIAALLAMNHRENRRGGGEGAPLWASIAEGLRFARDTRVVRSLLAASALTVFFIFPVLAVLPAAFVRDVLHEGPRVIGLTMAVSGGASFLGSIAIIWIPPHRTLHAMLVGALGAALSTAALTFRPSLLSACAAIALLSWAFSLLVGLIIATLQLVARGEMRGRVMSLSTMTFNGMLPMGAMALTVAVERFGFAPVYVAAALGYATLVTPALLSAGPLGTRADAPVAPEK